jgi:UPF0755 protein
MASDGGRWARIGRRRRDRDDHGGEDDYGDHSGHNGRGAAYPDADRYGRRADYGSDDSYGWPGARGQASGYGGAASYDSAPGYGDQASYADPRRYGDQPEYGDPSGYGNPNGYRDSDGYGDRNGYGGQAGYGETGGYGAQGGYRWPGGHGGQEGYGGHEGYGEPGYAESGFDESGYGDSGDYGAQDVDTSPYGPGSHGSADRPDPASGYQWQGPYGAADPLPPASFDPGSSYDAAGPARGYDTGGSGRADTGSHAGWAFTPGSRDYDPDPLEQGTEGFSGSPADGFGPDSGSFGRPDTGSFGRPDTGSFGRPDTGSFGRPDTGSFRRSDSETFGRPDIGALPARSGGYANWRDDVVDDDWEDDADGGLLSRRFGSGERADGGRGERGGGGRGERGDGGRDRARGRKPRRFRGKAAFTMAILTVALLTGIAAAFGYKYVHTWITNRYGDYSGAGTGTVEITVKSGDTLAGLGPVLLSNGVIMALRHYDTAAAAASGTLQPGVYRLHHHMNSAIAVKYLLNPKYRSDIKVTIIEGTRATKIAQRLAAKTGLKASAFLQLINHPPASLGLPSWAAGKTAEGFLFPDTYTFLPGESALKILQTMVSNFNNKIATIHLASAAPLVHTTPWHVLIVASLAQAEGTPDDFGKVARVAWNRYIQNMALRFDSTVFYGLGLSGNQQAAATNAEIKKDTPYNTYIHRGLPPGPIGNPGLDAIKAALHPTHGTWLYFITDVKTQKTYFTASYDQFHQWQLKFQG